MKIVEARRLPTLALLYIEQLYTIGMHTQGNSPFWIDQYLGQCHGLNDQ